METPDPITNPSYSAYDAGYSKELDRSVQLSSVSMSSLDGYDGGLGSGSPTTNTVNPSQISSGSMAAILYSGKQYFTDTTAGYRMGVDGDGIYKWVIGDSTNSIDWAVTTAGTLTIKGALSAVTGTIGGLTLASGGYIRLGQTAYNTGTGFWLGDVGGTAKFSIGNPSGKYLTWDGTTLNILGFSSNASADTGVIAKSADTERFVASGGASTMKKEIRIEVDGDYDMYFEIKSTSGATECWAQPKKNGTNVGTLRKDASLAYVAYNETITGLVTGDLLQLYIIPSGGAGDAYVRNFRIRASLIPTATVTLD